HAGAKRLFDDGVQIDEDAPAQETIELVFSRRVSSHQSFQRARLVGRVMIDMQVGILLAPSGDEVDEVLEREALFFARESPDLLVALLSFVVEPHIAE